MRRTKKLTKELDFCLFICEAREYVLVLVHGFALDVCIIS